MNQTINLHGKEYRIKSPFDPEYTEKLAKYCDSLMKNIGDAATSKDYLDVSVLTLLQVAHNYFQQLELSKGLNPKVEKEIARMIAMLDEAEKEAAAHRGEARHSSDK